MRIKTKSKKTIVSSFIILLLLLNTFMYTPILGYASSNSVNMNFDYSTARTQSQTITIPNLRNVTNVTTTNGNVSFAQEGNKLTVTVKDGVGESFQTGGTYTEAHTKWVDAQTSPSYNVDGYKGTLEKYVYSGQFIPADTKIANIILSTDTPTWNKQQAPATYPWTENGYSGTVNFQSQEWITHPQSVLVGITYTQFASETTHEKFTSFDTNEILQEIKNDFGANNPDGYHFVNPTIESAVWGGGIQTGSFSQDGISYPYKRDVDVVVRVDGFTLKANYSGNISRPESDTRQYRYRGNVTKPASDTRTWETRYTYKVVIEYNDIPLAPTINLSKAENTWQNQDVVATIVDNEYDALTDFRVEYRLSSDAEWKTYSSPITFIENGVYVFMSRVVTNSGTISPVSSKTIKIDKTKPQIEATVVNSEWTKETLTISISSSDLLGGVKRIQLPDGNWVNGSTANYSAQTNGVYTFVAEDSAGNRITKTVEINNIDKTTPEVTLTVEPSVWSNENVNIKIQSTDNQTGVKRIQLPNGNWISVDEMLYEISSNGTYTFKVEDNVGNITTKTIVVTSIDKTVPTNPIISLSNTDWMKGEQSFTLAGSVDSQSGISKYQYKIDDGKWTDYSGSKKITEEGIHTVKAVSFDLAGNISAESIATVYIDNSAPTLDLGKSNEAWTNQNVVLSVTAKDELSGVKGIMLPNNTWVTGLTGTYTVTENGSYSFTTEDIAGNRVVKIIHVTNIDKAMPTLNLSSTYTQWTNQPVLIQATASDNESGVKRIQLPNGTWVNGENASQHVSANGTYVFKTEDNVGNIISKQISISNIDLTAPTKPTVSYNNNWTKDEYVPITATPGVDNQSGVNGIEYKFEGATESGWKKYDGEIRVTNEGVTKVIFQTIDKVGNTSEQVVATVKIDRSVPHNNAIIIHLKGTYQP